MQKPIITLLLAALTSVAAPYIQAGEGKCDGPLCDSKGKCPIQAALQKLPALTYVVGDKSTSCSKQAAEMAKADKTGLRFAVQQTFNTQAEAKLFAASFAPAAGKSCEKGECKKGKKSKDGESPAQASNTQAALLYQVGAKTTSCSKSAAELSKTNDTPVRFVVRHVYATRPEATLALAEQTEKLVDGFCSSTECKVSGKFAVGGKRLECPKAAAAMATRLRKAIETVNVSYKVGDKKCDCPIEAKAHAAKSNTDVVFVVDGKETTCPIQHRVNTAQAKYRAAVHAIAKAED